MPASSAFPLSSSPRRITAYDASRSYVLPEHVKTNIPRRGFPGSYCAHDWARGHLVELHRRLGGHPLELRYRELLDRGRNEDPEKVPAHLPVGTEVTARLRVPHGPILTVITRAESAPYGPRGDYWQATVNGQIPADDEEPALRGVHTHPPSLPYLAFLVHQHLRRAAEQPLAPMIPIRPHGPSTGRCPTNTARRP